MEETSQCEEQDMGIPTSLEQLASGGVARKSNIQKPNTWQPQGWVNKGSHQLGREQHKESISDVDYHSLTASSLPGARVHGKKTWC